MSGKCQKNIGQTYFLFERRVIQNSLNTVRLNRFQVQAKKQKEADLAERIPAFPDLDSLDEEALKQLCRDLHGKKSQKVFQLRINLF